MTNRETVYAVLVALGVIVPMYYNIQYVSGGGNLLIDFFCPAARECGDRIGAVRSVDRLCRLQRSRRQPYVSKGEELLDYAASPPGRLPAGRRRSQCIACLLRSLISLG